jgi:hypothetical protein
MGFVDSLALNLLRASPAIGYLLIAGLLLLLIRELLKERLPSLQGRFFFSLVQLGNAARIILIFLIFFFLLETAAATFLQFTTWKQDPFSQFLLPPHQPAAYFVDYTWQSFGKPLVFAFLLAGTVFFVIKGANYFTGYRLFYDAEEYLAAIAILVVGWPNALLLLFGALILATISQLGHSLFALFWRKSSERFPLIYFWLPFALILMVWGDIIGARLGFWQLKI